MQTVEMLLCVFLSRTQPGVNYPISGSGLKTGFSLRTEPWAPDLAGLGSGAQGGGCSQPRGTAGSRL